MSSFSNFWGTLMTIPGRVTNNAAAFVGFAVVDYVAVMVLNAIPRMGGSLGQAERAVIGGMAKTIDFATWDAFNKGPASFAIGDMLPDLSGFTPK